MEVGLPIRPGSGSGMQAGARSVVISKAGDCQDLTVCRIGGRLALYAANVPSSAYCSARTEDGSFGRSSLGVGALCLPLTPSRPGGRARRGSVTKVRAEKDEDGVEETPEVAANIGQPITAKKSALATSLDFWLQVAIFVFAAGFVDAGFSGDWSRIGVLSKQTEEELQMAALGVVPLAITLIWSISQRRKKL